MAVECVGVPDDLVEERWYPLGEAWRTVAGHDLTWVGHMVLLILRHHLVSIPARWEHQLETNTISAVCIEVGLIWEEVAVERALGGLLVVEAVETESGLTKEGLGVVRSSAPKGFLDIGNRVGEVALVGITGDHLEASWEASEGIIAGIRVQEVVTALC